MLKSHLLKSDSGKHDEKTEKPLETVDYLEDRVVFDCGSASPGRDRTSLLLQSVHIDFLHTVNLTSQGKF